MKEFVLWFESTKLYRDFCSGLPEPLNNAYLDIIVLVLLIIFVLVVIKEMVSDYLFRRRIQKKQKRVNEKTLDTILKKFDKESQQMAEQYLEKVGELRVEVLKKDLEQAVRQPDTAPSSGIPEASLPETVSSPSTVTAPKGEKRKAVSSFSAFLHKLAHTISCFCSRLFSHLKAFVQEKQAEHAKTAAEKKAIREEKAKMQEQMHAELKKAEQEFAAQKEAAIRKAELQAAEEISRKEKELAEQKEEAIRQAQQKAQQEIEEKAALEAKALAEQKEEAIRKAELQAAEEISRKEKELAAQKEAAIQKAEEEKNQALSKLQTETAEKLRLEKEKQDAMKRDLAELYSVQRLQAETDSKNDFQKDARDMIDVKKLMDEKKKEQGTEKPVTTDGTHNSFTYLMEDLKRKKQEKEKAVAMSAETESVVKQNLEVLDQKLASNYHTETEVDTKAAPVYSKELEKRRKEALKIAEKERKRAERLEKKK